MAQPEPTERVAYLPPRAARARKLILRTQLGLPWLLGSVAVAAVILVAGVVLLLGARHPGAPWARVGPAGHFRAGAVVQTTGPDGQVVVVDRRAGTVRAFLAVPGPCPITAAPAGNGFARPCDARRWDAEGAPATAATSPLRRVPVLLADGALWVDPGRR